MRNKTPAPRSRAAAAPGRAARFGLPAPRLRGSALLLRGSFSGGAARPLGQHARVGRAELSPAPRGGQRCSESQTPAGGAPLTAAYLSRAGRPSAGRRCAAGGPGKGSFRSRCSRRPPIDPFLLRGVTRRRCALLVVPVRREEGTSIAIRCCWVSLRRPGHGFAGSEGEGCLPSHSGNFSLLEGRAFI